MPYTGASLLASRRGIIVPRQLKAYGGQFSASVGERVSDVASHLVLQSLTSETRLAHSPLLRKPVKTSCVDNFDDMLLNRELRDALRNSFHVTTPSPIQQSAVEVILQRQNTVVAAPHGEGKTLAFLLPLFQLMMKDRDVYRIPLRERRPRMLLVAPTRELVKQLHRICQMFGAHTGLSTMSFTSRPRSKYHLSRLLKNKMADIVVMDSKMLLRLIRARRLFIDDVRYVAVDEADALLSSMHDKDVQHLLAKIKRRNMYKYLWPVQTQVVFSTAYITRGLEQFVGKRFPDAVTCMFKKEMHRPASQQRHRFYPLRREEEKMATLIHLLRRHHHEPRAILTDEDALKAYREPLYLTGTLEEARETFAGMEERGAARETGGVPKSGTEAVPSYSYTAPSSHVDSNLSEYNGTQRINDTHNNTFRYHLERARPVHWYHQVTMPAPFTGGSVDRSVFAPGRRTIIFMRNIDSSTAIYYTLRGAGFAVSLLHAALPSHVRREMYADFCSGRTNILCATDLASRGLDVHVDLVINFDMPTNALLYLSRAGRAARMGRIGSVCSLYTKYQGTIVAAIKTFIGHGLPLEGVTNSAKSMTIQRYAEWRTHKINALSRAYVSMITKKAIPAHLERSYVHHNATWRPLFHPQTVGMHGGVPPRQQQRLMNRVHEQAVWFRRGQLSRRKGGRAKFGRKDPRRGVWNDIGGISSKAVANAAQNPNPGGVGPPSGPPA